MIPLSPAAHRVAAVVVTCALSSCVQPSLDTEYGAPVDRVLPDPSDTRYSKDIYDEFFGQYLPDYEHFGWEDADWLTADWVNSRHQPSPSAGQGNEVYHHLLDFNPFNYSRPGLTSAISATAPTTSHNASLISGGSGDTYWRQQDPLEWMPATASTYARSQYNDVMANQFWYRAREPQFRPKLQRALELCPDCDDVFTPLSHNDLYKIIEIRFAPYTRVGSSSAASSS